MSTSFKSAPISLTFRKHVEAKFSNMLPDFRVGQRAYLLEISRALTQELNLEKLLTRRLRIAIEILAG